MKACSFCEGELEERRVQYEYHWEGKLFVFEEVPARVCRQCGEKYFAARVVKAMEQAVLTGLEPQRVLQVPVFSYPELLLA